MLILHFYISCYENNEERQSDCSNNSTDTIVIDKVSLSSSDSHVGQILNNIKFWPKITNPNVVENLSSVLNIGIPVIMKNSEDDINHETANTSFTENHASDPGSHVTIANSRSGGMENNISDYSLLKDEANKTGNIIEHDLNHEKWNSQNENAQNVTSILESHSKSRKMDSSGTTHNAWRFKILLIFAACCIIGCYLIPFAVNAIQFSSNNTNEDFSNDKNISNANVSYY